MISVNSRPRADGQRPKSVYIYRTT